MTVGRSLNLRHFALATIVPIVIMIIAMAIKPLWTDEYWSLFFADGSQPLSLLFEQRWPDEVHPPLYYFLLHGWEQLFTHPFWERCLSLVFLIATGLGLRALTPLAGRRGLYVFFLVCLGSYWVIYFATEIRPYVLTFCLTTFTVILLPRLVDKRKPPTMSIYGLWIITAALLSLTIYFGALWVACLGFVAGFSMLKAGLWRRFVGIGLITLLALIPVCLWLNYSLQYMDLSDEQSVRGFMQNLEFAGNQYLRGLFVKTFASNPIVTFLGFGGLIAAFKFRNRVDSILVWAAILTTLIAFFVHFTMIELIKERAFIVIMPAILYIFAKHMSDRESKAMRHLPWVTAVMPLLFSSEYFKNKERPNEVQAEVLRHFELCKETDILAYYRPTYHPDFYPMAANMIMKIKSDGQSLNVNLVDMKGEVIAVPSECPIKVVGFLLHKRNKDMTDEAKTLMVTAGIDPDSLEEKRYGKGRNILWIEK